MMSHIYMWYQPQLEVHAPVGNKGHEEASNYIPFECKVFAIILFRSKAQVILKNWKTHVFAGFRSTTIVLIADKHFSLFF